MSTSIDVNTPPVPVRTSSRSGKHWIDEWDPEDQAFWESTGKAIARRNLIVSIFTDHIGFCIWVMWTIVVLNLADAGIKLSLSQLFWLTAVPNLIGALLRVPYTFAIPRFGGRLWTTISASVLFVPCLLLAVIVPSGWLAHQSTGTQFDVLLLCAATAGFGGGNFASSMANISFFYPQSRKGFALGLNAAGGNLGVAVAQLVVPLVVIIGVPVAAAELPVHHVHLANAGLIWMPFVVIAASAAWRYMDSLTQASADTSSYVKAVRSPQTWIMAVLYIGTFGSFIGYSFALPLVIKNTFPEFLGHHVFIATYLAGLGFVGAVLGSLARPVGGWVSDRVGGARVTLGCFAGMGAFTLLAIVGVNERSFPLFFGSYLVIFLFAGAGNGSTYRMIASIFAELGDREAGATGQPTANTRAEFRRRAAAVIGIAGAVGAFGGFLIQVAFRQASLHITALLTAATAAGAKKTAPLMKVIATSHDKVLVAHDKVLLAHDKAHGLLVKVAIAHAHENWSIPALWFFLGAYVVLAAITWTFYLRRAWAGSRVLSLAGARI